MIFKDNDSHKKLSYTVEDYSSYTSNYKPTNILVEDPNNPSSRWSTSATTLDQYITLKLTKPSIVTKIVFGKYCKIHVCNVREARVFSLAQNEECILKCNLRNDSEKETLNVKYSTENKFIISEKIKITPLSSWGMNFNYSIWYVELRGYDLIDSFLFFNSVISFYLSSKIVLKFLKKNDIEIKEIEEKLTKKYLNLLKEAPKNKELNEVSEKNNSNITNINLDKKNETNNDDSYEKSCCEVINEINEMNLEENDEFRITNFYNEIKFESKIITEIKEMVYKEKFNELEEFLEKNDFLFDEYLERSEYLLKWEELENEPITPRGGHQMVEYNGNLLVYGGWDGESELSDLWIYKINENKWIQLEENSPPGKRSCHKMINVGGRVYLFGRYIPIEHQRQSPWIEKEFYVWNGEWHSFSYSEGVLNLFDHQMIGEVTQENLLNIYIFGGRTQNDQFYSGLFFLQNGLMKCIRSQGSQPENSMELKGRVGHSLILIPKNYFKEETNKFKKVLNSPSFFNNSLLIVGGQRGKEFYKEITFYSLEYDSVYYNEPFPINCDGRITQRSVLNGNEIIIHLCYSKEKDKLSNTVILIYNLKLRKWIDTKLISEEPLSRTAHQFTKVNQNFYLFGGNTGHSTRRVNDLWKLTLIKPTKQKIINELKFIIRRHFYLNMNDKKKALIYIKEKIHSLLNERLMEEYKALCCEIIKGNKENKESFFERLLGYLPYEMCEIKEKIEDLIK